MRCCSAGCGSRIASHCLMILMSWEHILFQHVSTCFKWMPLLLLLFHPISLFTDERLRATRLGGDLLVWVWRHVWQEMGLLGNWVACFLLLNPAVWTCLDLLNTLWSWLLRSFKHVCSVCMLCFEIDSVSSNGSKRTLSMVSRSHERYESAINFNGSTKI